MPQMWHIWSARDAPGREAPAGASSGSRLPRAPQPSGSGRNGSGEPEAPPQLWGWRGRRSPPQTRQGSRRGGGERPHRCSREAGAAEVPQLLRTKHFRVTAGAAAKATVARGGQNSRPESEAQHGGDSWRPTPASKPTSSGIIHTTHPRVRIQATTNRWKLGLGSLQGSLGQRSSYPGTCGEQFVETFMSRRVGFIQHCAERWCKWDMEVCGEENG